MSYLIGFCAGVLASIVLMIIFDGIGEEEDDGETLQSSLEVMKNWLQCRSIPAIECWGKHCETCPYDHGGSTGMMIAVEYIVDYLEKEEDYDNR